MWPKALAQLIELAPHITRLVPAADRFLNTKTASEEASRNAMQQMAEGLRGDLGQVTAAHAGLYQRLTQQGQVLEAHGERLAFLAESTSVTQAVVERLEQRVRRQFALLAVNSVALIAVLVLVVVLLIRR